MIAMTGSPETLDEVRKLGLEHVHRSRSDPGCISRGTLRLREPATAGFCRIREDRAALAAHFAVPASRNFVRALHPIAASAPDIQIYDATTLEIL